MRLHLNRTIQAVLFLGIGLIGFADSSFLAMKHYLALPVPCFIVQGCDIVTTSRFSMIGPVPLAVLGMLYYLVVIILAVAYFDSKKKNILLFLAKFSVIGFATSVYLVYLQAFILHAFCLYCLISATTSTLLFLIGVSVLLLERRVH